MKKILCLCLACLFLMVPCILPTTAEESERTYLARLNFNEYNDYRVTDLNFKDVDASKYAVTDGVFSADISSEKYRVLPAFTAQTLDNTKTLVVEGDYYVTGDTRFYVTLYTSNLSNNYVNLFLIRLNQIYDFKKANESTGYVFNKNTWYNIKVVIHLDTNTKDLYIDNVCKVLDANLLPDADMKSSINVSSVFAMGGASSGGGTVKMDNFAMYYTTEKIDNTLYIAHQTYDTFTTGKTLTTGGDFKQLPEKYEIKEESGNKFLRVYQNTPTSSGPAVTLPSTTDSTRVVLEEKIRWSAAESNDAAFTIQVDVMNGSTSKNFTNLVRIKPNNNNYFQLNNAGKMFDCTPKENWKQNNWYTFKFVIDCTKGTYEFFVDGELYGEGILYSGMYIYQRFFVIKTNVVDTGTTSYIDVDNSFVYYDASKAITYKLNGVEKEIYQGRAINVSEEGKAFLFAELKANGVTTTYSTSPTIVPEDKMEITTYSVEFETDITATARTDKPVGLRFVTKIKASDVEKLQAQSCIASMTFGTIITKKDFLNKANNVFTKDALNLAITDNIPFVDVVMKDGVWYDGVKEDGYKFFAGSLTEITDANANTKFCGIGYLVIKLSTGKKITCYANINHTDGFTVARACKNLETLTNITNADRLAQIQKYINVCVLTNRETYSDKLNGLNVLAIGDSLFRGDTMEIDNQWINVMGKYCNWNLTNLGRNGYTVSYVNGQTRGSMYNLLTTDKTYKFNGNAADVDIIFFEGGYNDYGSDVKLGTNDSNDVSTFLGAWNVMTDLLLQTYPNATIVFVTPWQLSGYNSTRTESPITTYLEYTTAINKLYDEKYATNERVTIIDAGDTKVSGIYMDDSAWRERYSLKLNDRFHLNREGMLIMEENMYPYVNAIVEARQKKGAN